MIKKFKKGTGTFLEFSITSVMLLWMFLMFVGIFIKRYTIENFDLYTDRISREIVVCDSLEDAESKARSKAYEYFQELSYVDIQNLNISVDYQIGSDQSWHKGSFVTLTISAPIKSAILIDSTRYEASVMVMIEHN